VRQSAAAAAGASVASRRGRPPGSVRGTGSNRARGGVRGGAARPRRNWGGDDDDDEDDYQPLMPRAGRGSGGGMVRGHGRGRTATAMPQAEDEDSLYFIVRTGRVSLQQTVDDWIAEYKVRNQTLGVCR